MRIAITNDAFSITSTLTVEEIKSLEKNCPDALKVKDDEGNVKFSVGFREGKPSIVPFGVTFGGKSRDGNGYATFTDIIPAGTESAKDYVADLIAPVKVHLEQVEEVAHVNAVRVKVEREALLDEIVVA